jgi:histidinol-phosphate phosphatase family protein
MHRPPLPRPDDAPRRAAFLDRDGTLIEDRHSLSDPGGVRLVAGAAAAVRALNAAGVLAVVITNQSGIARGYFTEGEYERVEARIGELFAAEGARFEATYHCPHHPAASGPCGCRKPGTLLYERAMGDWGIDMRRSLYVGDRWRDVEPALAFGGLGVLVATSETAVGDVLRARSEAAVATTLGAAVARLLAS